MDRLGTQSVVLEGGVIKNLPVIDQGIQYPGSLRKGQNFEPDYTGGYKRIKGYSKFDDTRVGEAETTEPTGAILGCWVVQDQVVAIRERDLFAADGTNTGWTKISTTQFNATPQKYYANTFVFDTEQEIVICNGIDYPARWDGTTFSFLSGTGLNGANAPVYATEFKHHMFYCRDQLVTFSNPGDIDDISTGGGGGTINVGHEVTVMIVYRDALYLLGPIAISKIVGNNSTDFELRTVSKTVGCIEPATVAEVNGDIVFLARDGVRSIASTEKLDDVNLENLSRSIEQEIRDTTPWSASFDVNAVVFNSKNQYRFFVSDSTAVRGSQKGFLGALRRQSKGNIAWEWYTTLGIEASAAGYGVANREELVVHGDYDGYVYKQDDTNAFDGDTISASLQFPYWSYNDPEIRKTLHKLRAYVVAISNVNPSYQMTLDYLDTTRAQPQAIDGATALGTFSTYGSATYGSSTYSTGVTFETEFYLEGTCFNSSLVITSSDTLAPYTIQTLNIQFSVAGRK